MGLSEKASHAAALLAMLGRHPAQLRYAKPWLSNLRRPTMSSRLPWLPFALIDALDERIDPNSKILEFGGGGSTIWFAQRASQVVTVEHDAEWFPQISTAVRQMSTCTVMFRSSESNYADYVAAADGFENGTFDVVLVDGRERVRCIEAAMPKLRSGGWMILDDSSRERYKRAFDLAQTWKRKTFDGFGPFKPLPAETTVWTKP